MRLAYIIRTLLFCCLFTLPATGQHKLAANAPELNLSGDLADTGEVEKLIKKAKQYSRSDTGVNILLYTWQQSKRMKYNKGLVGSLKGLGNIYLNRGKYEIALKNFLTSVRYYDTTDESIASLFDTYGQIAQALSATHKLDAAAKYYFRSLDLAKQYPRVPLRVDRVYVNLGKIEMTNEQPSNALYYYNMAEPVLRQHNDMATLGALLFNKALVRYYMAQTSMNESDILACREQFQVLLAFGIAQKDTLVQYRALTRMSMKLISPSADTALKYIKMAERLMPDGDRSPYLRIVAICMYGQTYFRAGKADEAIHYYYRAIELSNEYTVPVGEYIYEGLAESYATLKQFDSAYKYQLAYGTAKDTTRNENIRGNINELTIKFKAAEKDKDIDEKKLQLARQQRDISRKNMWLSISIGAVVLVFATGFFYYRSSRHKQHVQQQQIVLLEREKEIELLRGMINGEEKERARLARELHDGIGGMLTSANLTLNQAKNKQNGANNESTINNIQNMIGAIATEVRKTAHNLMPDVLTRHGLEDALLMFCANINAAGGVQVEVIRVGDLSSLGKPAELVLYRITQELIQNVVKHASATMAVVQLVAAGRTISISVEDDGVGYESANVGAPANTGGYGLQNLQYRVHALQGTISIHSQKGVGTTTYLSFDLEKLENIT